MERIVEEEIKKNAEVEIFLKQKELIRNQGGSLNKDSSFFVFLSWTEMQKFYFTK